MPAKKKTFSRAPSQRRSHSVRSVEFISQIQIIDCGLHKLDPKRISPERTDAVAFLFLKPSYDNNGFRKHQVLRKMSQDQELKDEKNPSSLTELW